MRRIEFIAPVEAMRGNLSGDQVLKYAENMNPAWDAPNGKQFAKNYKPRYVGAKRAASGLTYFATKVKSAVVMNDANRRRQAALGCVMSLISALKSDECEAVINSITYGAPYVSVLKRAYDYMPDENGVLPGLTLEQWVYGLVYELLYNKRASFSVQFKLYPDAPVTNTATFMNPFGLNYEESTAFYPWVAQRLYDKFIDFLAAGAADVVHIDKQALPCTLGDKWSVLIAEGTSQGTPINRATLLQRVTSSGGNVLFDSLSVYLNSTEVATENEIEDAKYTTTAPA